ncbi:hypothetical protein LUZ61_002524 [Rhynchospora tenuis]|uniref:Cupin type-1 domain-containing protein n=1 Tax=Rhynchospora tenuis TaxID=198213 RepID=A0AAD5ZJI4_9POAL|nr:hypothetical protein LUZ61_002524 [Rhynchospora tenuis]
MGTILKTLLPVLLLALLSLSTLCTTSQAKEDPQLKECRRQCSQRPGQQREQCEQRCWEQHQQREQGREREREREQEDNPYGKAEKHLEQCRRQCEETQYGGRQLQQCKQQCQQTYEQEKQRSQGREGERGWEQERESSSDKDPQERIRQCKKECREQHGERQARWQCEQRCEQRERGREHGGRDLNPRRWEEEEEGEERQNPYVFKREHFKHKLRTEHGNVRVLTNFAKRSKLLLGIANYRIVLLELNPRTFVLPNHWDADDICYVVKGRGTVTVLKKEEKQSHSIRQGDIMKVDSGSVVYVINSDSRDKLIIAKLVNPVSTPGKFETFFGAGGENPESFYRSFSDEVLEAAFNTERERIERVFGKQRRGPIVRASEEQIRSMTRETSEGGHHWPFGEGGRFGESRGPFNILRKRPTYSNQFGQLHEADANDYRPLEELDVKINLANISSGSMEAPTYNSRSTMIAVVVGGRGWVEIVCPHLGKQSETGTGRSRGRYGDNEDDDDDDDDDDDESGQHGQKGQRYRTIRAKLSPGTVFVVPAGHPFAKIASRDENIQIMCFNVPAEKNERVFLAGRNNVMSKMEREAKELAFDTSAREVDELFNSQREEAFMPGPESRRSPRGGPSERHGFIESILEAAAGM